MGQRWRRWRPVGRRRWRWPIEPSPSQYRRDVAAKSGTLQAVHTQRRRHQGDRPGGGRRRGDMAGNGLLPGAAGRAGRRIAVRPVREDHDTRLELLVSRAHRRGPEAQRGIDQPAHRRLSRQHRFGPGPGRAGRAAGKPDADRGSEYHRRRFRGAVAHQERRRLSVQHSRSRGYGEAGGRERHSRGDGADASRGRVDHQAPGSGSEDQGTASEYSGLLQRRRLHRRGQAAQGGPALGSDRRVQRRAARSPGQGSIRQRGAGVPQRHRAEGQG